ncbi:uncharacterized protein RMCN_3815 [Mycolicibacterium novocastrense]|uniref:Uncharacterized protein n=1 Tax=Mycolicibacterium novocastrense TaxID=59813 RepID=A0ABQ0KM76_MYCNV|nr:uncharacterized protein RMCN_3815 [Mycolicibacterium novocastrense]
MKVTHRERVALASVHKTPYERPRNAAKVRRLMGKHARSRGYGRALQRYSEVGGRDTHWAE